MKRRQYQKLIKVVTEQFAAHQVVDSAIYEGIMSGLNKAQRKARNLMYARTESALKENK